MRESVLDKQALDIGGKGLFEIPLDRTSWPIRKPFLGLSFVEDFEKRYSLDPDIETVY